MTARKRHLRDHARTGRIVLTGLWADAVLVMASSAYNGGEAFVALHQPQGQGIALGVAVDVALAVALVGDRALHLEDRTSAWGRALRIVTAAMSLALNCGVTLWQGHLGVAIFHAFLPVLLVLLSEYAQDITLQFGEIADEYKAAEKADRDAQLTADRAEWEARQQQESRPAYPMAPIPVAAPPIFRVGGSAPAAVVTGRPGPLPAGRPDFAPAVQPGGQPTDRPGEQPGSSARTAPAGRPEPVRVDRDGSPRKRPGKPKTDAQLSRAVRELAEANGGSPPSQYAVRQQFSIGGSRAARLLAELDTTPAGPPSSNGAATREGSAR